MYLCRVNAYIKYGLDKDVCNPYGGATPTDPSGSASIGTTPQPSYPEQGWIAIASAFHTTMEVPKFNDAHIVAYFVTRTVADGLPASDFKSINNSGENLFLCGHVQAIQVCRTDEYFYVKANCIPEMRKDRIYLLHMALQCNGYDIVHAECGCPAGKGPQGSCKHIAALSFALVDFCRLGVRPEFLTCTDKLQQWNRPRERCIDPIPVDQLGARRRELTPQKKRATGSRMIFDPRPPSLRKPDPQALEYLRCDLLNLGQPCGLLSIIIPSTSKVEHDHCYCLNTQKSQSCEAPLPSCCSTSTNLTLNSNTNNNNDGLAAHNEAKLLEEDDLFIKSSHSTEEDIIEKLSVSAHERVKSEEQTRSQSSSDLWFEARRQRLTGSICGRVLNQKAKTIQLLRYCIYPKPMLSLPKPIAWGRDNESKACLAYVQQMQMDGHSDLRVKKAGFVVHPKKGWLGASPDAWVTDPSVHSKHGIAEFKCPYAKANVTVEEACEDKGFCCFMTDSKLHLKKNHPYYHQVQLQLYVANDLCSWCDFCVYTTRGVAVERIYPDVYWQLNVCPQLDSYFFEHILPELVYPQHKPSYYL